MSDIQVRAHPSRSTRGTPFLVRRHQRHTLRILKKGSVAHAAWLRSDPDLPGTLAFMPYNEPDIIYLYDAKGMTSKQTAKTIAHENVHQALNRIGEREASQAIDGLPSDTVFPESGGLYSTRRRVPLMARRV